MLKRKKLIKKLEKFLKTAIPSGFADGLMFGKYKDLLSELKKGDDHDSATLEHFLGRSQDA